MFYYETDGKLVNLSRVQDEYDSKEGDISKYRNKMLCPECRKAKLRFTHKQQKKNAYLSKLPSSSHRKGCSYIHPYASKNGMKKYIESLDEAQISSKLEATLNQLRPREGNRKTAESSEDKGNPVIIKKKTSQKNIDKRIRTKSLNRDLGGLGEDDWYIFYGYVKLEVKPFTPKKEDPEKPRTQYRLLIKIRKANKWVLKAKVYRWERQDNIDENKIYDIAILGKISRSGNYLEINTEKLDSIMYRESKKASNSNR